jgi:hypothetical protein
MNFNWKSYVVTDPQQTTNREMSYRLSKKDPFYVPTIKEEYARKNNNLAFAA